MCHAVEYRGQARDFSIIPCGDDGDVVNFECDSIAGTGAHCPRLLSNEIFVRHKMNLLAGFFQNGGGLLVWRLPLIEGGFKDKYNRAFITDSGHYLLPVDNFEGWDGEAAYSSFYSSSKVSHDDIRRARGLLHDVISFEANVERCVFTGFL